MLLSLPSRVNNFDYEFMTLRRDDSADKKTLTSAFPSSSARPTRHTTRRAGRDAVSVGGGRVDATSCTSSIAFALVHFVGDGSSFSFSSYSSLFWYFFMSPL